MTTFLSGISLKNYRGISAHTQKIGVFKSCNFFIGTNNSGKSCVLNFISSHLDSIRFARARKTQIELNPLEVHLGARPNQVEVGIAIPTAEILNVLKERIEGNSNKPHYANEILKKLIYSLSESEVIWISANSQKLDEPKLMFGSIQKILPLLTSEEWYELWIKLTHQSRGNIEQHWVPEVCNIIIECNTARLPDAKLIPAKRQIGSTGKTFTDFSGAGLIDKLAELQNPSPTARALYKKFEDINSFLQDVISNTSAKIEIPHDREEVLVHSGERVLPLSYLGTGIHEVVMIAAFCTLTENSIVCIEEPEIHLHPVLQKKLIRYIAENTSNQYFIATHSASIIDYEKAAVFHVSHDADFSEFNLVSTPSQRFNVCHDLGYRASDLLQTNSVIWVEGPSDRLYIKHWIKAIDANLQEGIHYSIMFYGGRLLSHLSATDDEVTEFISLRRLNRNAAIVIDSDRTSARIPINKTKQRVLSEFNKSLDVAWLTAGREIENYIAPPILEAALKEVYPSFLHVESHDKYAHRLQFFSTVNKESKKLVDKVKVAHAVCKYPADLTVFDLQKQITKLVEMIKFANK